MRDRIYFLKMTILEKIRFSAEVLSLGFPVSEVSTGKLSFDVLCKTLGAEKRGEIPLLFAGKL